MHEFEGLLFSDPKCFSSITNNDNTDDNIIEKVQKIRDDFKTPEHINNSKDTAPSKRLESIIPKYSKVIYGTIISKEIGIDRIMNECKHFNEWIRKIIEC